MTTSAARRTDWAWPSTSVIGRPLAFTRSLTSSCKCPLATGKSTRASGRAASTRSAAPKKTGSSVRSSCGREPGIRAMTGRSPSTGYGARASAARMSISGCPT
ncbi:hypothetical protein D3C72_2031320 [compost metagenome]